MTASVGTRSARAGSRSSPEQSPTLLAPDAKNDDLSQEWKGMSPPKASSPLITAHGGSRNLGMSEAPSPAAVRSTSIVDPSSEAMRPACRAAQLRGDQILPHPATISQLKNRARKIAIACERQPVDNAIALLWMSQAVVPKYVLTPCESRGFSPVASAQHAADEITD